MGYRTYMQYESNQLEYDKQLAFHTLRVVTLILIWVANFVSIYRIIWAIDLSEWGLCAIMHLICPISLGTYGAWSFEQFIYATRRNKRF